MKPLQQKPKGRPHMAEIVPHVDKEPMDLFLIDSLLGFPASSSELSGSVPHLPQDLR